MKACFALLLAVSALSHGAAIGDYLLEAWGSDSVRVRVTPPNVAMAEPPFSPMIKPAVAGETASLKAGATTVTSGNLRVDIDAGTGLIKATRVSDGAVLLTQKTLQFGQASARSRAGAVSVTASFSASSNERIYGLGEHRIGRINLMPSFSKNFEDSQIYGKSSGGDVTVPFYLSSVGYGFLWGLPSYGSVNINSQGITWTSVSTVVVDFWISTGPADGAAYPFPAILHHYVDAVGHAPPMPSYTTGFIQCKDRYRNQTQLLDVLHGYKSRNLPISVIVIDWQHWVHQGDWTFNPNCWPNPQEMVNEIKAAGVEPMVTFWPFQTTGAKHWSQFSSKGWLATYGANKAQQAFDGDQYLVDQTNPDARAATFDGYMSGYGNLGFHTVWFDACEPERMGTSNDLWNFQGGTDAEIGEAWVAQHMRSFSEGFIAKKQEFMLLGRSGWTGTWKYGAALWSGDIGSSFDELSTQVRVAQEVAISGFALWTTDIGGYWNGNSNDANFQELIVRWFQFGAFCPLFRLHGHRAGGPPSDQCGGTNGDNEVWNLAKDDAHYKALTGAMFLREQLRPYVTRINKECADTGLPMVRPMFLSFPDDSVCTGGGNIDGQYMFGDAFLVAPVTKYQAKNWNVYLPKLPNNEEWVYWYNNATHAGGNWVTIDTPINEFPLFYRPHLV